MCRVSGSRRRLERRRLVVGLAAVAAFGAAPAVASASPITTWSDLQNAFSAGGTVQLGASIAAPSGGGLDVGATPVTLDLNGFDLTITQPASNTPAITVPSGDSLTIEDTSAGTPGTLTATGAGYASGIGEGLNGGACGSVTIDGGAVSVTGSTGAAGAGGGAGIGGGPSNTSDPGGAGCAITIDGGTVTGTGVNGGAGIGGGFGNDIGGDGGAVTINGGTVTATGGAGGAGIGGGANGGGGTVAGAGATVTITGGNVTASGNDGAPGIGGALGDVNGGPGGSLTVKGGSVTTAADGGGVAVGGGYGYTGSGGAGAAVSIVAPGKLSAAAGGTSAIGGAPGKTGSGGFGSLSNAGTLTIPSGATLTVPSGVTAYNTGTLALAGTLNGGGTLDNSGAGAILDTGTVAGNGDGNGTGTLLVAPNNYALSFDVNGGSGSAPATEHVYAPTVTASGQSLPGAPALPSGATAFNGWYTAASGGTNIGDGETLSLPLGSGPVSETLYAQYEGPLSVTTQPHDAAVTALSNATFTAGATGYPVPTVQWQSSSDGGKTWQNVAGANSNTLTLTSVNVAESGTEYQAVFTNSSGSVTSNAVTLTVTPIVQSITFTPLTSQATALTSAAMSATGGGSGQPVSFSVDKAGTSPADACAVTQTGPGAGTVSYAHIGTCVIDANQAGSADGNYAAAVTVSQTVTITPIASTVTVSAPAATVFGQGAAATATVSEADGSAPAGTVQFTLDGSNLGGPVTVAGGRATSPALTSGSGGALAPGAHRIGAVFTPQDQTVYAVAPPAASVQQDTAGLIVSQAATATSVSVSAGAITAGVSAVAPGAGTPGGTVTFMVDGRSVGTASLASATATLAYNVPAGATRAVSAVYSGDADFTGSSASTSRSDPTISYTISGRRSRYGWYRTPVTITFTCATQGAPLTTPCPSSVTLTRSGAAQSVTRTITAANGGAATAAITGIDLDRTRPSVRVLGVRNGHGYDGVSPRIRCAARDRLSGVARCRLLLRRSHGRGGLEITTVRYTATAISRAGTSRRITGSYRVLGIYLQGVAYRDGAFQVRLGHAYTIVVHDARVQPRYWDASPGRQPPAGIDNAFHAAGRNRWAEGVTLTGAMSRYRMWQLGVRIGNALHAIPIHIV